VRATPVEVAPIADPTWRALVAQVDEARMQERVRMLCELGPRMGGTDSGHAAAAKLIEAFRGFGVAAQIREDPELWSHQEDAWSVAIRTLDDQGQPGQPQLLSSAWPWGFSPSASGSARLTAELAEGSALLTDRRPRFRKSGPKPAVALVDGLVTLDGSYPRIYQQRGGDANPVPIFGLNRPDGEHLRSLLASGAEVQVDYELEARIQRARPRTVIGRIPARPGAAPGFLLYCAHGDSDAGGPGADDNASGVAVVLEIARAWSRAIAEGSVEPPERELRFAVWGSEIHSTRAYLADLDPELAGPLLGVINYDQAGYGSGGDQLNIEPDDLPANRALVQRILAALAELDGRPGFPERWATNKSLGGTDSYVFSGSRLFRDNGRPALTLFTSAWDAPDEKPRTEGMPGESWTERDQVSIDYDLYYHSAGDTPENTTDKEPWNMGWCARVGLIGGQAWLADLSDTEGEPSEPPAETPEPPSED
jgi:aminopeptidase YwaD